MKIFLTAFRCACVGFILFNMVAVFAAADAECVVQPDGSCLKIEVTGDRDPGGGGSLGGGGGDGQPMGGGNGGTNTANANAEQKGKEVVDKYELPCRPASQSVDAYTVATTATCTTVSYDRTLDENPGLKLVPSAFRVILLQQIAGFCAIHVSGKVNSGQVKTC
jgi:hypothetical protein